MNRNDVIEILAVITAGDGRREPVETDVEFWQEIIGDLSKDLALQAVKDHFRTRPGVWLEPGHIVTRAREIRRDMLARDTDYRRNADDPDEHYPGDAKAADDLPDYPREWTAEQRVGAYWAALRLNATPTNTNSWYAIVEQAAERHKKHTEILEAEGAQHD
jgi:hypothetical protein